MVAAVRTMTLTCGATVRTCTHSSWSELSPWKPAAAVWSVVGSALGSDLCITSPGKMAGPWEAREAGSHAVSPWHSDKAANLGRGQGPQIQATEGGTSVLFPCAMLKLLLNAPGTCFYYSVGSHNDLMLLIFSPCVHVIHFLN